MVSAAVAISALVGAYGAAQAGDKAAAVRDYLAGADAAGAGHRDVAVRDYLAGEAADPTYALNYFALADLLVQAREYAAAQIQLQRLLALNPRTAYAHYYLALVLEAQHQNNAALKNLDAELQINPSYAPAKRARAEVLAVLNASPAQTAAVPAPTAAPSASATAHPPLHPAIKAAPRAVARVTPVPVAKATQMPAPSYTNFPVPTPRPTPTPLPTPLPPPAPTTFVLTPAVTADAKGYLLEVTRGIAFTQALPPAPAANAQTERTIADNLGRRGSYDALISSGTAELNAGRVQLARRAFASAGEKQSTDWRAPYLEGLAAQADGDLQGARGLFTTASQRAKRPEILTSLAVVDVRLNDLARALTEAQSAAGLDAAYQPAQFVAGLTALASGDAATAARRLEAAVALGHAPERTQYFLDVAQRSAK